jgi:hypothetical protein
MACACTAACGWPVPWCHVGAAVQCSQHPAAPVAVQLPHPGQPCGWLSTVNADTLRCSTRDHSHGIWLPSCCFSCCLTTVLTGFCRVPGLGRPPPPGAPPSQTPSSDVCSGSTLALPAGSLTANLQRWGPRVTTPQLYAPVTGEPVDISPVDIVPRARRLGEHA